MKGRSTEVQLLHCTNLRVKAIDNKRFVDTVYIDFAKAFDKVSHAKLLHKLPKYGITGNVLKWFASFLNGRKQRVKGNNDNLGFLYNPAPLSSLKNKNGLNLTFIPPNCRTRVKFKDNELAITWYVYVRAVIYFLELCSDALSL